MSTPMVESFRGPGALPADVQAFMAEAEKANIGAGLGWYRNLVAAVYPDDHGVRFYVMRSGDRVRAVVPLRAQRTWLGWRVSSLSNFYTSLYEPSLAKGIGAAELVPLLSAVAREFRGMSSLTLAPMDPNGVAYRTLQRAMKLKGWVPFDFFSFGNWYLPVRFDWATYLSERSSAQRNTIRRMGKKFANDGGRLEIVTGSGGMPDAIAAYERVYAASWKQPEPYPRFMPGLLQDCAARGFLRLGLAWIGGEPVAAQLWIVAHGRAEIYKLAYDEKFKAYSPGTLLTAMLMEYAIEVDNVAEVDYLIGEDPYKKTWMSHRRDRRGLIAFNPRTVTGLAGLALESAGRLWKAVRARMRARGLRGGTLAPPHS